MATSTDSNPALAAAADLAHTKLPNALVVFGLGLVPEGFKGLGTSCLRLTIHFKSLGWRVFERRARDNKRGSRVKALAFGA